MRLLCAGRLGLLLCGCISLGSQSICLFELSLGSLGSQQLPLCLGLLLNSIGLNLLL